MLFEKNQKTITLGWLRGNERGCDMAEAPTVRFLRILRLLEKLRCKYAVTSTVRSFPEDTFQCLVRQAKREYQTSAELAQELEQCSGANERDDGCNLLQNICLTCSVRGTHSLEHGELAGFWEGCFQVLREEGLDVESLLVELRSQYSLSTEGCWTYGEWLLDWIASRIQ